MKDPYFRLNEREVQWVDKEDWEYKTTLNVDAEIFDKRNVELNFKGLDTYADVYLNDSLILKANNMFREWHAHDGVKMTHLEAFVLRFDMAITFFTSHSPATGMP